MSQGFFSDFHDSNPSTVDHFSYAKYSRKIFDFVEIFVHAKISAESSSVVSLTLQNQDQYSSWWQHLSSNFSKIFKEIFDPGFL